VNASERVVIVASAQCGIAGHGDGQIDARVRVMRWGQCRWGVFLLRLFVLEQRWMGSAFLRGSLGVCQLK